MIDMESIGLSDKFQAYFKESGFKGLKTVQKQAIPKILKGQNVIAIAATGSGKTLAYALPIVEIIKLKEKSFERGPGEPLAIVVVPTRELANQIEKVFKTISHHLKFRPRVLVGGRGDNRYFQVVKSEMDVLIGTPNTIRDAIKNKHLNLSHCQLVVLDEADQLLDMGFTKDLGVLYAGMSRECNLSMFSATMDQAIFEFAHSHFSRLKFEEITLNANQIKTQRIETYNISCSEKEKISLLMQFLAQKVTGRGILFVSHKGRVELIEKAMQEKGIKIKYKILHGDLEPKERERNHKAFVEKKAQMLLATDIAARGINIDDLEWVINYELPKTVVYYLHRSGRVARGKLPGSVYNFISAVDEKKVAAINEMIREQKNLDIDVIKLKTKPKSDPKAGAKKVVKKVEAPKKGSRYEPKVSGRRSRGTNRTIRKRT
jgi:superfamily II DNA/RNA helicase